MGTRQNKRYILIFLPLLIFLIGISPFLWLFYFDPYISPHSTNIQDPSHVTKYYIQSETIGQISGEGFLRSSKIQTNISETQLDRTDNTDILVQTNYWNITYSNLTFTNLIATNMWKSYEETVYDRYFDYRPLHKETWAAPFNISTNCFLDTIEIKDNAIYQTILGSSFSENVNITICIWNSTLTGTPDTIISKVTWINKSYTFIPYSSLPAPTNDQFNLTAQSSSVFLDTAKTVNKQFFVSVNCSGPVFSQYNTTLGWYYKNTAGGKAYNWSGSWTLEDKNQTLKLHFIPINKIPTPSSVALKVNSSTVLDLGPGSGYWINISQFIASSSSIRFDVSSNWSIQYDVIISCTIQNETYLPTRFLGIGSNNLINWNVSIALQSITLRVTNFTINVTVPFNWNQTSPKVMRPNNPFITADVDIIPMGTYSIFQVNSEDGLWVLYCTGPNYLKKISIEKKRDGQFILPQTLNTTINITDTIRINGSLQDTPAGVVNLSIYSPLRILNYSDSQPIQNAMVNFTPFTFESFTNETGPYFLQLVWKNGEQVGIKNLTLDIVYPTTLTIHSPTDRHFIMTDLINLTIQYTNDFEYNKFNETGIELANVTCIFGNSTKNDTYNLTNLGNGYYTTNINTVAYAQGFYYCNLTAGLPERNNISVSLLIELVYNTTLVGNLNFAEVYFGYNITLNVNYSQTDPIIGITAATVQCYIDGKFYSTFHELGNGNYTLQVNTSGTPFNLYPGQHSVKINATRPSFFPRQISLQILINATPTEIRLYQNITQQGGRRFNLTVTHNATSILNGKYLSNSTIRCFLDGAELTAVDSPAKLNNGYFYLSDFNNGTYNLELLIDIGKNRTQSEGNPFIVTIIASHPGYIDANVSGIINIWVWNTTVIFTSWDSLVNYGENVTINLLYFNTTNALIDGVVTCDFPGSEIIRNAQGNYTITFNTTGQPAGDRLVAINVTLVGHEWNLTYLNIHIKATPTLISPYPTLSRTIKVNQTLENIVIMYNQTNGQPIIYAHVEITLTNSTHQFSNNTGAIKIYYTYENGVCIVDLYPGGLHQGNYNLTITIENHTDTHAYEPNRTIVLLTIEPLESYLLPVKVGAWWSGDSLSWYENESLLLKLEFDATFYDLGAPYNASLSEGAIQFNLYKDGEGIIYKSGYFTSLHNGTYILNLTLDMQITPLTSNYYETYVLELIGTAQDCQTAISTISLFYYAKNIVSIFLILPTDVIEGEIAPISAKLEDNFGTPVEGEQIIFTFAIKYKSGFYQILTFEVPTDTNGIATVDFRLPYNIESFEVSVYSEASVRSITSNNVTQEFKTYSTWYLPVRFLKRTWYIFVVAAIGSYSAYYYFKKYKPRKIKIEEKRETLNYKYVSAVNLLHLLVYEKQSRELLYAYSSPGLKLTSYLINSVLQSMSMYVDMPVEFQEIYLQDDVCLTLTDGNLIRVAVLSKNLPSVEMQKQIAKFIDLFEEAFKDKIPDAIKNIIAVSRIIDMNFANQLIEECFEKSLTFPHIAQRPADNQPLTDEENKIHKLAYTLNEKSGPFLLGRLLSKARMETGITELPKLIEIVFKLREKEALKPIPPKEAEKLKYKMMREKIKNMKKSEG